MCQLHEKVSSQGFVQLTLIKNWMDEADWTFTDSGAFLVDLVH